MTGPNAETGVRVRVVGEYEHGAYDFDSYPDDLEKLKNFGTGLLSTTTALVRVHEAGYLLLVVDILGHKVKISMAENEARQVAELVSTHFDSQDGK